jgi:hypothetical protein
MKTRLMVVILGVLFHFNVNAQREKDDSGYDNIMTKSKAKPTWESVNKHIEENPQSSSFEAFNTSENTDYLQGGENPHTYAGGINTSVNDPFSEIREANQSEFEKLLQNPIGLILIAIVLFIVLLTLNSYFRSKKTEELEPFNSELSEKEINFLRNSNGSPGETSKVLTQKYYSHLYNEMSEGERINHIVDIRVNTFEVIMNVKFPDLAKELILKNNKYNIPMVITMLYFFEDVIGETFYFEKGFKKDVYRIILEEHNKYCPSDKKVLIPFDEELYTEVKEEIQKYYRIN